MGILKVTNKSFVGDLLQEKSDPIFGSELKNAEDTLKGRVVNGVYDNLVKYTNNKTIIMENGDECYV